MSNIISLGMSFLCGVFVPMELLGDGVRKINRFLPVYWYESINTTLGSHSTLTSEVRTTILQGFLIQAAFAAACLCITLAIVKKKAQER